MTNISPVMRSPSTRAAEARAADFPGDVAPGKGRAARAFDVDALVVLLDAHLHLRTAPHAAHVRRHDPQVHAALVALAGMALRDAHGLAAVRRPARHGERVRHDARARRELVDEARLQLLHQRGQQVDRYYRCPGNVGGQHVALHEARPGRNLCQLSILARLLDQRAVELDAEAARAELLRRGDDDAAVARAEVDHQVVGTRLGHLQHALDNVGRRGDERRPPLVSVRGGVGERKRQGQKRENSPHLRSFRISSRTSGLDQSSSPRWR